MRSLLQKTALRIRSAVKAVFIVNDKDFLTFPAHSCKDNSICERSMSKTNVVYYSYQKPRILAKSAEIVSSKALAAALLSPIVV